MKMGRIKMSKNQVWPVVKRVLCVLLLLFSLVLTIRTAWIVSTTLIDSDTSSELVLSEKLAREGGIMSTSWVYSTELQVIDCHIIYSLLFHFTSDWSMVRFLGCVIMNLMMLGAMGFLFRQARIPFNRFCLAGAAILLPWSVPYGRIILYHNYYTFHICFSFMIVGFYLGALRRLKAGEWKRWPFWAMCAGLAVTSFADGLGGVRSLMICVIPLVVTALLTAMRGEKNHETGAGVKRELPGMLLSLVPLAFVGIGYLVNLNVLAKIYKFTDYSGMTVTLGNFTTLHTVLTSLFTDLGFQNDQQLFSAQGLLGVCGVVVWILSLILAAHTLRKSEEPTACFMQLFWLMVQLIMTCVFLFLSGEDLLHVLYLLPILVWMVPALAAADVRKGFGLAGADGAEEAGLTRKERKAKKEKKAFRLADAPLSVHGLLGTAGLLLMVAIGVFYAGFFQDPSSSPVQYTGLNYNDTDTVKGMQPIADYLKENGYTLAYASYWDSAVLSELSDGAVKNVPVQVGSRKHPIKYVNWLSDMNLWNPEFAAAQKVAIVANMDLYYEIKEFEELNAQEVATFGGYSVYELTNPAALAEDLS